MSIILNKEELSTSSLRRNALEILESGLSAIDTEKILRKKFYLENSSLHIGNVVFDLSLYQRTFFIGVGKCASDGAKVVEEVLGDRLTDGVVIDVKKVDFKKIRSNVGTHPYPSEVNISATAEILNMIKGVNEKDLVLVLVSGGGSSLFCMPHSISCETLVNITRGLTHRGADIFELNTVRKHFSEVLGGGLAKLLFPASVASMIFSDVLGNDKGMIASGPTVYDTTTVADAAKILIKYHILEEYISPECEFLETPKHPKYFTGVKNILIASNRDALLAMQEKAIEFGFETKIETEELSGDAREVGLNFAKKEYKPKSCFLYGGETTVKVVNPKGVGGRNQEVALSALPLIKNNSILISSSSDGWDNTNHAGALADFELFEKSKMQNISVEEFLNRNDSYNFFKQVGGAILTGKRGSNVSDLYIMLYE